MADDKRRELLLRKRELLLKRAQTQTAPQDMGGVLKRGFEAVAQTPGRVAQVAPEVGSMIGGMAAPGILPMIGGGIAGRAAGSQLKQELQQSPLRGLSRFVEPMVPGVGMLTRPVAPEQSVEAVKETVKKIPMEIGMGVAGGIAGQMLRGIRPLGRKPSLRAAREVGEELQKQKSALGKTIGDLIDKFPEKPIDIKSVNTTLKTLPGNVLDTIRGNPNVYGVEFMPNGVPVGTMKNMQALKEAIGDYITSPQQWANTTRAQKELIKGAYRNIRNDMVKAQPALKAPLEAYQNFINEIERYVKPLVKSSQGKLKEKALRGALKPGADEVTKESIKRFTKLSDAAKRAIQTVQTLNRRQAALQGLKRVAPYAGALAAGGLGLKTINRMGE